MFITQFGTVTNTNKKFVTLKKTSKLTGITFSVISQSSEIAHKSIIHQNFSQNLTVLMVCEAFQLVNQKKCKNPVKPKLLKHEIIICNAMNIANVLLCWCGAELICWFANVVMCLCVNELMCWYANLLLCWCAAELMG